MPPRSRIVHIITRLDMGGSAQNTLLTLIHLPAHHDLTVITGPPVRFPPQSAEQKSLDTLLDSARGRGVEIIHVPFLVRSISPWNDLRALLCLVSILRRLSPQGVHTHTSKAGLLGRIAAKICGVPWVVHTPHGHVFWGHFGRLPSWAFLQIERWMSAVTDHLIALTNGEAEDYVRLHVMKREKLSVIPSGVSVECFYCEPNERRMKRARLGIAQDALAVGFVGWLWPVKGVRFLMDSMTRIMKVRDDVVLVLVGQGEEERVLRERVAAAHLEDRALFCGWRPDVPDVMACFDLLVLPSLNEGMGRVLVEAMAAGLPVIGTRVGGIPDLICEGENGLLVPPADADALHDAILSLLTDPERRELMGRKGKEMCCLYSVEIMVQKISEVYRSMGPGRSPGIQARGRL